MATEENSPSFARDIQPLFREKDRASMKGRFDLWNYRDVSTHAQAITRHAPTCELREDGKWPEEQTALFRRWVEAGMPA